VPCHAMLLMNSTSPPHSLLHAANCLSPTTNYYYYHHPHPYPQQSPSLRHSYSSQLASGLAMAKGNLPVCACYRHLRLSLTLFPTLSSPSLCMCNMQCTTNAPPMPKRMYA